MLLNGPIVYEMYPLVFIIFFSVYQQGSRDNMSIVIVAFEGAPRLSEEAVKQDQDLDAKIEAKIKGISHNYISENMIKVEYIICVQVHN